MMSRARPLQRVALFLAVLIAGPPIWQAHAQGPSRSGGVSKDPGTVYTFYGLRKLEDDDNVPEDEKLREWQAFIERAKQQLAYARRATARWKKAARRRIVAGARDADRDSRLTPRQKIARWAEVARLFPKSAEYRTAQRRTAHWTKEETRRLVKEAEAVERARRSHLDRIRVWQAVLTWAKRGPEAKAAERRIRGLQRQLYSEAIDVDKVARIDQRTKLAAWKDVLAGRPTRAQKVTAERRVRALKAELQNR